MKLLISQNFNHKKLILAREFRSLTQTQLSKMVEGLDQGNLSRMEKNLQTPSEDMLKSISAALTLPLSFFLSNHVHTPISEFYYRKRKSISKKKLLTLEATMDILRLVTDNLLDAVEIESENILPSFNLAKEGGTPEEVARKVRSLWKVSKGPIQNIISLFERNGIIVFPINTDIDKFDGITVYTDKHQPIIFINNQMSNDRKRFTLGHELGHLIMHIPFSIPNDTDEENEANRFSAEFNMPELDIRHDLYNVKMKDLLSLKRYWHMSMAALIRRAKDIKAIQESKYKSLMIGLSRKGWRRQEPLVAEIDKPQIIHETIRLHTNELDYTYIELAESLFLSLNDFQKLFEINQQKKIIQLKYS